MEQQIKEFLDKERVGALSVTFQDGGCHSAAMHFSYIEEPFQFYFSTDKTSRKAEELSTRPSKAAFVLGFSEEEWKTLQVSGEIRIAREDEIPAIKEIHYAKNPGSKKFEDDPNTIFLILQPTRWSYKDFNIKPLLKIGG